MHGLLIIAALSIIPHDGAVLRESLDVVERNIVHDADGCQFIDQLVFWRLDPRGWHEVQDWRWAKDYSMSYHPPRLLMTDNGRLRQIDVGSWVENHTQFDVEMADQELLPTDGRRKLRVK